MTTAVIPYRGRICHRFEGYEEPSGGRMGAPKLACGKELPYRTDRWGYKHLHRWFAWIVYERPDYHKLCPTCWPDDLEIDQT